jgi:hypothetical protein
VLLKSKSVKVMNAHPAGLLFTRVSQSKLRSFQLSRLQIGRSASCSLRTPFDICGSMLQVEIPWGDGGTAGSGFFGGDVVEVVSELGAVEVGGAVGVGPGLRRVVSDWDRGERLWALARRAMRRQGKRRRAGDGGSHRSALTP